jgi:urea transport system permease protein
MALGLAIVFGLMGVINMAHGELMAMGAYCSYGMALLFERFFPGHMDLYLFAGIALAFVVTSLFGFLLERGLIRHLYRRPLDTLLATWGVSLILQQLYRQFINPREVEVPTVAWLKGAWEVSEGVALPLSRIFIIFLAIATAVSSICCLQNRSGCASRRHPEPRDGRGSRHQHQKVDAYTAPVGLAGIAGSSFTILAHRPHHQPAIHRDTFIVVVFGGVESLIGTVASAFM